MKKKFFAIYALAGALVASPVFTSCVDSEESASVTALRGAKAEQLKAAAALANAQATAETTLANAEAALKVAQAAYQNALTDSINQSTEQAAQKFAIEISKLQAETEKAIAEAKKATAEAMASAQNVDDILLQNYKDAVGQLMTLNEDLIAKKASVAYLEAGVVYAEANAKTQIASYEKYIAAYEAQIEVLKDPKYTNINKDELYAQQQAANKAYNLASQNVNNELGVALCEAGTALKEAYNVWKEGYDLINDLNALCTQNEAISLIWDDNANILLQASVMYSWGISNEYLGQCFHYEIDEIAKLANDRYFEDLVKTSADALGTSADTKDKNTAYGILAAANDQMKTAEAMPATTDAEKDEKEIAIEAAKDVIASAKNNLGNAQRDYDYAVAQKEAYDAAWEAIDLATINTQREALVEAYEAQEEAQEAYDNAYKEVDELYAEYQAISYLYNNATNINEQIANLEKYIADAKQQIAFYQNEYVLEAETALETLNQEITNLEAEIEIQTQLVAKAKAALDTALAEE